MVCSGVVLLRSRRIEGPRVIGALLGPALRNQVAPVRWFLEVFPVGPAERPEIGKGPFVRSLGWMVLPVPVGCPWKAGCSVLGALPVFPGFGRPVVKKHLFWIGLPGPLLGRKRARRPLVSGPDSKIPQHLGKLFGVHFNRIRRLNLAIGAGAHLALFQELFQLRTVNFNGCLRRGIVGVFRWWGRVLPLGALLGVPARVFQMPAYRPSVA